MVSVEIQLYWTENRPYKEKIEEYLVLVVGHYAIGRQALFGFLWKTKLQQNYLP